jgi:hypothetical protein
MTHLFDVLGIEAIWELADEAEKRVLVEELVECVTIFPITSK